LVNYLAKPWLLLPPQTAHDLSSIFLSLAGALKSRKTYYWKPFEWKKLSFSNPLGIAGGVDKNAQHCEAWWKYGVGFVEVGTITPEPQGPNPNPILKRDISQRAVWNKMGFPNKGLEHACQQLSKLSKPHYTPVFVNVGKNRSTAIDTAAQDYIKCIKGLEEFVDVFVINISSPNTANLRDLFSEGSLKTFLRQIINETNTHVPLLLKLSPDLDKEHLRQVLETSLECGVDGWIVTNTSVQRPGVPDFPQAGGLSGKPLAGISKKMLKLTMTLLGENRKGKLIVSTGGIMNAKDIVERLNMGADLVQVYSSLIFDGPFFFRNVADKLVRLN